jgi:glycosyltransferase involved in cell wall biosynthesis
MPYKYNKPNKLLVCLMKNKVTIVVPCKNEESYISHLLDSLKAQRSIAGVKIYIADASTDSTRQVIENHKGDLNVEVIEGGPVSTAKNNGAKLATTPYILFIDSDVRFFKNNVISDTVGMMDKWDLDLIGLKAKCYDRSILASLGFTAFNLINSVLSNWIPFAVGAYMLTRTSRFNELGGFPEKYATSEDFFLSKQYDIERFAIANHYFGQDSRRFKKMGYFGMVKYLLKNFINRNNEEYWKRVDAKDYW